MTPGYPVGMGELVAVGGDPTCLVFGTNSDSLFYTICVWGEAQGLGTILCWAEHLKPLTMVGGIQRWWRNRMGRPLSPKLTHQKIIWMLSNWHKTTSGAWQRNQAPRKAAHFLQKEVIQNIIGKKRDRRFRDGDPRQGVSCEGGEVFKHQEILSLVGLWRVLKSRG